MNLDGRTALVTGAARGIGRELTRHLIAAGCHVAAVGREARALAELEAEHVGQVTAWPADLARADEVDRLVRDVPARHPNLTLLINNAGVQVTADVLADEPQALRTAFRDEIAINLDAVVGLSTGLLPHLAKQPSAAILNVSSGLALAPKASAPVYCATKAAVRSFTKALRYQCEDAGLKVLVADAVMALVDTDMTRGRGAGKMSAVDAAAEVLAGLKADRNEIYVGKTKLLALLTRAAPSVAERIMRRG
ncbi:SDR family oxidoreductase [Phenylobacterium sp.]|uniref:SDR family oxidoreductase n=1 Tax=Phenylobacterium sp. TaxID=1871053 RepID=UPI003D290D3E